ncbi:hypothetical protein BJY16_007463 [Actinoplanes octamycinicus]|uniref:Uncharacterized protein n=1 Tax=Actinoplanes octamycinicus TaxID=135948 RepID=A0A7W7MBC7_9ACTN|nr:hypothetical protein [Actinoplanes octamycinicus]MBB4744004.1 hypothetical protein [Actinoplanes octamycinicus]GIE58628.1 hypothetical protein Aoc01nite_40300 [Actinoplanes octamycinicus]
MNRELLYARAAACGLSLWELGDLLGIHPHHLHRNDNTDDLSSLPVKVIIELARRLDLHPGDLIPDLEPAPAAPVTGRDQHDHDALTTLTALATTSVPLTTDALATALSWTLDRTTDALQRAVAYPHLGGPVALRRVQPSTWTVSARRDVLTTQQHDDLANVAHFHHDLTTGEATALLAAHAFGNHPDYATWREDHLDDEQSLKTSGLLHVGNDPDRAHPTEDVEFSLYLYPYPVRPRPRLNTRSADINLSSALTSTCRFR